MWLNYINNYFLILFSLIPLSLILGSSISLINILLIDISFLFFFFILKIFLFLKIDLFNTFSILYLFNI